MKLYIQIENGQPVNHPSLEDNLIHAFGSVPENWQPFNRIQQPGSLITSRFQVAKCTYELSSDGVTWQDVWTAEEMTDDEKNALIADAQSHEPLGGNVTLDINTLSWIPNTTMPTDNKRYFWNFDTGIWEELQPPSA